MFNDKLVFDDEPIYPRPPLAFHKQNFDLMKLNCTNIFSKNSKFKIQRCKLYIIIFKCLFVVHGYETKIHNFSHSIVTKPPTHLKTFVITLFKIQELVNLNIFLKI
jgi:hypothetical protein